MNSIQMHETRISAGDQEIIYRFEVTPKTLGQITAIAEWRGFIQGLETLEHFDFGNLERNHELEEAVASVCIEGASINIKEAQTLMEDGDELEMDKLNKSQRELVAYLSAIKMLDEFSISHEDVKLIAKPDPKYLHWSWKHLIFNEDSAKRLIDMEEKIRENSGDLERKWLDKEFDNLKKGKGMVITHASALFYFAFGGPYPSCYWTPAGWWKHVSSGKTLDELKNELTR